MSKSGEALPETTFEDALKAERAQLVARAAAARDDAAKAKFNDRVKQVDEQLKLRSGAPRNRRAAGDQVTG